VTRARGGPSVPIGTIVISPGPEGSAGSRLSWVTYPISSNPGSSTRSFIAAAAASRPFRASSDNLTTGVGPLGVGRLRAQLTEDSSATGHESQASPVLHPMIDVRRRLHWEEGFDGSAWCCRFRVCGVPLASIVGAIVAGLVVAFLGFVGQASAGGGATPIVAALAMALPTGALSLCVLLCDLEGMRPRRIRIDRQWIRVQWGSYETAIPTAEVGAVVAEAWGVIVKDRSGAYRLTLAARDAEFVLTRVERALAWAREPQAYR
jgi:hypothetical protein